MANPFTPGQPIPGPPELSPDPFGGAAEVPFPPDLEAIAAAQAQFVPDLDALAEMVRNVNLHMGGGPEPSPTPPSANDILDEAAQLAERTADEIKEIFSTSTLWEFERALGNGSYGITMLMRNRSPLARRHRRVVLKRSIRDDEGLRDMVNEMDALWALRGHAHIAQIIDAIEDVMYLRPRAGRIAAVARRILGLVENPPQNMFKTLSFRRGPAIILEYLENGSLAQLQCKALARNIELPNRVMWSWFYCMMRACVGMTYVNKGYKRGPLELETLQPDGEQYFPLQHCDIAARNLMIAEYELKVPEHQLVPKLVTIDFGISTWAVNPHYAQLNNMYQISMAVIGMIVVNLQLVATRVVNYNGIRTRAGVILPDNGVDPFPRLDPDLRNLLVRTLHDIEGQRPDLPQLLEETRVGMMKGASAYPGNPHETDDYIKELLQGLLHDA
ncbi:hypothetical protein F5B21DRAFT_505339 [Xylaria acuta]|nr:hypothetical protein F5B21DRAFT_505339 [Xylaria acuta]